MVLRALPIALAVTFAACGDDPIEADSAAEVEVAVETDAPPPEVTAARGGGHAEALGERGDGAFEVVGGVDEVVDHGTTRITSSPPVTVSAKDSWAVRTMS